MEHRLALATGACAFFLLLAPLDEFASHAAGKDFRGMTLAALLWLAFFVVLSRRLARKFGTAIAVTPNTTGPRGEGRHAGETSQGRAGGSDERG